MQALESVREEDEGIVPLGPADASIGSFSATTTGTPPSPAAQQRVHARQHSRIHERNLSAFFPRPGQATQGYGGTYDDPHVQKPFSPGTANIPTAQAGQPSVPAGDPFVSPPKTRRGHHHRHSVSHNLFPFLDSPNGGATAANVSSPGPLHSPSKAHLHVSLHRDQLPAASASFRQRYGYLPFPLRLAIFASFHIPLSSRLLLGLAVAQVITGATLWVQGQAGESLAVVGLGYLVVFDGIGAVSSVLLEQDGALERTLQALGSQKDMTVRRPYGPARIVTLSHFSQAVYLLFSAFYVCKESVEHVLLLHGPQDTDGAHGAGHGGVGHGEGLAVVGDGHGDSITLPHWVLFLATITAMSLAVFARNHSGLSHALQKRTTRLSRSASSKTHVELASLAPLPAVLISLANPFTATVLLFSIGLLGVAFILPPAQHAPVDKVLALLESFAMFYIAQPAASATGQVLLQTSPGREDPAVRAVEGLVQEIETLPVVRSVDPPHLWQLSSSTSSSTSRRGPASSPSALTATPTTASPGPTLIATLLIHAHHHATDTELLDVTQQVRQRVERANERLRDRGGGGGDQLEVTVQVKRG